MRTRFAESVLMEKFGKVFKTRGIEAALTWAEEHWDDIMPDDARQIYHMTGVIVKTFR